MREIIELHDTLDRTDNLLLLGVLACFVGLVCTEIAAGAGVARSDNFSVYAPSQPIADAVLKVAEVQRQRVAREWFDSTLPDGAGRATVYIEFTNGQSKTQLKDNRLSTHQVFLACPKSDLPKVLKHEVSHCVTNTFHGWPNYVPAELDERIALTYNTPTTQEERAELKRQLRAWESQRTAQHTYPQPPRYYTPPGYWMPVQRPLPIANFVLGPIWVWQPLPQQPQQPQQ